MWLLSSHCWFQHHLLPPSLTFPWSVLSSLPILRPSPFSCRNIVYLILWKDPEYLNLFSIFPGYRVAGSLNIHSSNLQTYREFVRIMTSGIGLTRIELDARFFSLRCRCSELCLVKVQWRLNFLNQTNMVKTSYNVAKYKTDINNFFT